jgi:hypothetical protein
MLRVVASLVAIPALLVLLLAATVALGENRLGSVTIEAFELGLLPLVLLTALLMLVVFGPLLLLTSRFTRISPWNAAAIGLLSALLPVVTSCWSVLIDGRLHASYRIERLADGYPWLIMGAVGGTLFWVLALFRNRALSHLTQSRL